MSLYRRTILIVGAIMLSLIVILYVVSRVIILERFRQLEEADTQRQVERALSAVANDLADLNSLAGDWAPWDETYAFIQDGNRGYIELNVVEEAFNTFQINVMLFVNLEGKVVFGQGFDLQNQQMVPLTADLEAAVIGNAELWHFADTHSYHTGLLVVPEGALLIASQPILTSSYEGPLQGALIFGRYLDAGWIERLSQQTHLAIALAQWAAPELPPDLQVVRASLTGSTTILVRPLDEQQIAGYTQLRDVAGQPALILKVELPRSIYAEGQNSLAYFLSFLIFVSLVFAAMMLLLLERLILRRLRWLSASVSQISAHGELNARLPSAGDDELGRVVTTINEMLIALHSSTRALHASERSYRGLFNSVAEAIYIQDRQGRFLDVNDGAMRMYNRPRESFIGQPPAILSAPDRNDFAALAEQIDRAFEGEPQQFEFWGQRSNGEIFLKDVHLYKGTYFGQEVVIALAQDITDRKRAETRLARLTECFLAFGPDPVDNINRLTALCGELLEATAALYNRLDAGLLCSWGQWHTPPEYRPVDRPEGHICYDVITQNSDETVLVRHLPTTSYAQTDPNVQPYGLQTYLGQVVRFDATAIGSLCTVYQRDYVPDEDDKRLIGVIAAAISVEERRKHAEEAEHQQRVLAEMLRDTAAALNSTLNYDDVLDRILINVGQIVPYTAANLLLIDAGTHTAGMARHQGYAAYEDADYLSALRFQIADVPSLQIMLETGQPVVISDTVNSPGWVAWPETRWIKSYMGTPLHSRGAVIGFLNLDSDQANFYTAAHVEQLKVFADQAAVAVEHAQLYEMIHAHAEELERRVAARTHELQAANDQLSAANTRLAELDHLKDQFISRISHELRTPLTSIKIYLELLDRGVPEKRLKYLMILTEQVARLQKLIEDLLDVSRLSSTAEPPELAPIHVTPVIRSLCADWATAAGEKDQSLIADVAADLPQVWAEATTLVQALSKLLSNAVNYTPSGGMITVGATAQRAEGRTWVAVTIEDTGPGIPPAELPHIFDRFYRGHAASDYKTPGTGLGLSIAQQYVRALGGRLTVTSEPGRGAGFTVWLRSAAGD